MIANATDIGQEVTGGLLTGINPVLAVGSVILAIALTIAWVARFITARDGWMERRQQAQIEDKREQRTHEQELARQKAETDAKIVDQVLNQTSAQTDQLIAQSNQLQDKLFQTLTEQLSQMTNTLGRIDSNVAAQAVSAEAMQAAMRSMQIEMSQLRNPKPARGPSEPESSGLPVVETHRQKFKPRTRQGDPNG